MNADLADQLRPLIRPRGVLRFEKRTDAEDLKQTARMLPDEAWPDCPVCKVPMSRLLDQPVPEGLLPAAFDIAYLTVFHCMACWAFEHEDDVALTRAYSADQLSQLKPRIAPENAIKMDRRKVTLTPGQQLPSWDLVDRYPGGSTIFNAICAANEDAPWEAYQALCESLVRAEDIGTWIGGYPHGPQGGSQAGDLPLIVQIDSLNSYMPDRYTNAFGDAGVMMIFADPARPREFVYTYEMC